MHAKSLSPWKGQQICRQEHTIADHEGKLASLARSCPDAWATQPSRTA